MRWALVEFSVLPHGGATSGFGFPVGTRPAAFLLTFRVQLCKLLLIKLLDRELNGQERVQKASVLLASILRDDRSAFRLDESSLYQFCHIFSHGVRTHIDGFTNRFVACMALICRPILSVHQIAVDSQRAR